MTSRDWHQRLTHFLGAVLAAVLLSPVLVTAQDEEQEVPLDPAMQRQIELLQSIQWQDGPTTVDIGSNAQLQVPEGYRYTGRQGAIAWNELTQNPPDQTLGILLPTAEDKGWFLAFSFDDVGYVKDDEELDADALLEAMQEGAEASNDYRRQQGWGGIHVDGWIVSPKYDGKTNNLIWATKLHDDEGHVNANHNIRVLGRRGVMTVMLVAGLDEMQSAIGETDQLLAGFSFKGGEKYSEFVAGDKVAQYGLTGLIAGGAAIAAVKTGLFGKLLGALAKAGKLIVVAVIAVFAGLKKLLFGRSSSE